MRGIYSLRLARLVGHAKLTSSYGVRRSVRRHPGYSKSSSPKLSLCKPHGSGIRTGWGPSEGNRVGNRQSLSSSLLFPLHFPDIFPLSYLLYLHLPHLVQGVSSSRNGVLSLFSPLLSVICEGGEYGIDGEEEEGEKNTSIVWEFMTEYDTTDWQFVADFR